MNLTFEEKKFRVKPYTQCFQCIQGNRLKCKKCMASLVEEVIRERQKTETLKHRLASNENQMRRTMRLFPKRSEAQIEVKSNYGLWMQQVQMRRTVQKDPFYATLGCWPQRKTNNNRKKMAKVQMPRFESWEGRLLARFSKSHQVLKSLEKGLGLRS